MYFVKSIYSKKLYFTCLHASITVLHTLQAGKTKHLKCLSNKTLLTTIVTIKCTTVALHAQIVPDKTRITAL